MKKRMISILLMLALCLGLCACKTDENEMEQDNVLDLAVGGTYVFGAYEQDNQSFTGKEDIEWIVLDVKDGSALLISKYALDCRAYHSFHAGPAWEDCELRSWLNNEFVNDAFTREQQMRILTTTVTADKNPSYETDPGNDTEDKVFLLSIDEVNKYMPLSGDRMCKATEYAIANGAYTRDGGNYMWWLRTPGHNRGCAAFVDYNCEIAEKGGGVHFVSFSIRPALWIDLES